jgi:hypothetical protein
MNCLLRLALNHNPPDLILPTSLDYRCEPPATGLAFVFDHAGLLSTEIIGINQYILKVQFFAGGVVKVVKPLSSKCEVLRSNPSYSKKKKKKSDKSTVLPKSSPGKVGTKLFIPFYKL